MRSANDTPKQGPWTRIRPLQIEEVDDYTAAGLKQAELTWGHFPNNLAKVVAYCPRLIQTLVEYANTFLFDPETFMGDRQVAGFNDRFIRELIIVRTSIVNRSRYSLTHHSFIGMNLYTAAGRRDEALQKFLRLHEHEKHPGVYTERERVILDYAVKVAKDAHTVTDEEFQHLRDVLRMHNTKDERLARLSGELMGRHIDTQIVELTWLIGHFCLLNRWFSVLQVPDEGPDDEANFLAAYEQVVPEDIRERNEEVLKGDF